MKGLFSSKNKKVHLCLSGGGALGFAHIGVIQALEENGIYATHISGASMGAIIGAFYAAGIPPEKMLKLIREDKLYKLSKLLTFHTNFWRRGLSDQTTLKKLIHELIPHNSFEGLEKKLYVCVSNMNKADAEIICSGGDLDKWIAASASIPAIFELVNHQNTLYLDGGFMNNMPAQCFEKNYNTTIGVDVLPYKKINLTTINGVMDTAMTTVRAMQCKNSQEGRDICTYLIEPFALEKYNEFSYEAFEEIYKIGYNEAIKYIKENRDILNLKNS